MNELRSLLSTNQSDRLKKEKAAQDRIDDPRLPRHTVYQGDRKIQQLGQDVIENGVIINNQSLAIGDVMLPLAKGNVLRRVDNTNGGALLGTAYRDALENDFDANGNRRETELGRNGGQEPSDPNKPRKPSDRVPPPFGCVPPPSQCFWSSNPIAPDGFQNYGDAVVNENAEPTYLHCKAGSAVPKNLNCEFLLWKCVNGQCLQMSGGTYETKQECEAARSIRWKGFLTAFYNGAAPGFCTTPASTNLLVAEGVITQAQSPVTAVIDNTTAPTPGCPGKNHYAFIDALGNRLAFISGSADGAYVQESFIC
jgi:hypothetical protein